MARKPDRRTGKARQGSHPKPPPAAFVVRGGRLTGGSIHIYEHVKSGQAMQKLIRQAARENKRVEVVVTLKSGAKVELMGNRGRTKPGSVGMSAKYVIQDRLKDGSRNPNYLGKTAGSLKGGLANIAADANQKGASDSRLIKPFDVDDIAEMQLNVFSRR